MDLKNVKFIRSTDLLEKESYWITVMQIARNSTVNRIMRCSQIMGRKESESLSASQIFYPCMQCADVFELNVDITQLGMDQRKVNVLAREIAPKLGLKKPVVVSHHMLMGLGQPISKEKDAIERPMIKRFPPIFVIIRGRIGTAIPNPSMSINATNNNIQIFAIFIK